MALRQARGIESRAYNDAAKRMLGLGTKKRAKLLQRMVALHNGILIGPPALPMDAVTNGSGYAVAPHWRRGHFRMQPYGPGRTERKLLFLAPVLIHADQLKAAIPRPKTYRAGAAENDIHA